METLLEILLKHLWTSDGKAWHGIIGVEEDSTLDSSTNTSHFPVPFQLNEQVTWRGAIQGEETKVFE
jgi:hypothetical protein